MSGYGRDERRAPQVRMSPRERQVLGLVATGMGDKEVARRLGIGETTVRTYLQRFYLRAGVHSRTAAVVVLLAPERWVAPGMGDGDD